MALENAFYQAEEEAKQSFARDSGFQDFRDSTDVNWQHDMKKPLKEKDMMARIAEAQRHK
jgi:hypothetical protein